MTHRIKGNKYRNVKTVVDGITFDSKKEAARYQELKLMERAGEIYDLELQKVMPVHINGEKVFTYKADFVYKGKRDGGTVIEDVKSEITRKESTYRIKKKCIEATYGIRITEV